MATALSNLLALLALDNSSYIDALKNSQKAADTFGGNLATVGGAVVLGALTAAATAVIGIGSAAFDAAETLDEAYDKIAVATGAMGPELDILKDDFDAVFAAIPTDAVTAADAIGVLNSRLDISGESLQDLAIPLLEVTRLLGGDAKANAELFTRVIGDWNIPVDQAAGSLDKLFIAAQDTGVPIDSLMDQIVQYGAPLRNFGFSFEQAGGLLAKFTSEGVNTEIVMSGMRIAQGKFIKSGVDMQTGLWDTVDAIKNATDKTDGLALATEVFGAKAAGDMYDTIIAGKLDIDGLTESMLNADGAILEAAAATSDWGEKWKIFQNKMTLALGPIGEKLREGFGSALDSLVEIFNRPDVQAGITQFANFAVAAISAVVDYIPTLINGILSFIAFLQNNQGIVVGVFAALGVAAVAWGVVTAAAAWAAVVPMLPVIVALLWVAGYVYMLYKIWDSNFMGIQDKTAAVWAVLQPIFQKLWEWLSTTITGALKSLSGFWLNVLLPAIQSVWSWLSGTLFPYFRAIADFISAVFNVALTAMAGIWQNVLAPAMKVAWEMISNKLSPAFKALSDFWTNTLQPVLERIKDWIGDKVANAFSTLSTNIKKVTAWLGTLTDKLNNIKLPKWMTPGSPTPWEMGLRGVSQVMRELANASLPTFQAALSLQTQPVAAGGIASGAGGNTGNADMLVMEEIRRMLRDLPNEIARATTSAAAKMPRSR